MKKLKLLLVLWPFVVMADPPQPVSVDFSSGKAATLEAYQSNVKTFRWSVKNSYSAVDLSGYSTFMYWATSSLASAVVTARCSIISSTGGVFDALFSASDLNYTASNGYMYGVGISSGGVTVARQGAFILHADPYASGADPITFSTSFNWAALSVVGFPGVLTVGVYTGSGWSATIATNHLSIEIDESFAVGTGWTNLSALYPAGGSSFTGRTLYLRVATTGWYTKAEADALFSSDSAFTNWLATNTYVTTEVDPIWTAASNGYSRTNHVHAQYATNTVINSVTTNDIASWNAAGTAVDTNALIARIAATEGYTNRSALALASNVYDSFVSAMLATNNAQTALILLLQQYTNRSASALATNIYDSFVSAMLATNNAQTALILAETSARIAHDVTNAANILAVGAGATNIARAVGAGATNIALAIGAGATNLYTVESAARLAWDTTNAAAAASANTNANGRTPIGTHAASTAEIWAAITTITASNTSISSGTNIHVVSTGGGSAYTINLKINSDVPIAPASASTSIGLIWQANGSGIHTTRWGYAGFLIDGNTAFHSGNLNTNSFAPIGSWDAFTAVYASAQSTTNFEYRTEAKLTNDTQNVKIASNLVRITNLEGFNTTNVPHYVRADGSVFVTNGFVVANPADVGSELVYNGGFNGDLGWRWIGSMYYNSTLAVLNNGFDGGMNPSNQIAFVRGATYKCSYKVNLAATSTITFILGGATNVFAYAGSSSAQTTNAFYLHTKNTSNFVLTCSAAVGQLAIDDVSIKLVQSPDESVARDLTVGRDGYIQRTLYGGNGLFTGEVNVAGTFVASNNLRIVEAGGGASVLGTLPDQFYIGPAVYDPADPSGYKLVFEQSNGTLRIDPIGQYLGDGRNLINLSASNFLAGGRFPEMDASLLTNLPAATSTNALASIQFGIYLFDGRSTPVVTNDTTITITTNAAGGVILGTTGLALNSDLQTVQVVSSNAMPVSGGTFSGPATNNAGWYGNCDLTNASWTLFSPTNTPPGDGPWEFLTDLTNWWFKAQEEAWITSNMLVGFQDQSDPTMSGDFDRDILQYASIVGSVTALITGTVTSYSDTLSNLFDNSAGTYQQLTKIGTDTTYTVWVDMLANQPNHSSSRWSPFVHQRKSYSYFKKIDVAFSTNGTDWIYATNSFHSTTNARNHAWASYGMWAGDNAQLDIDHLMTTWRYVRFSFSDAEISTLASTSATNIYIGEIGVRHLLSPYQPKYANVIGDNLYGTYNFFSNGTIANPPISINSTNGSITANSASFGSESVGGSNFTASKMADWDSKVDSVVYYPSGLDCTSGKVWTTVYSLSNNFSISTWYFVCSNNTRLVGGVSGDGFVEHYDGNIIRIYTKNGQEKYFNWYPDEVGTGVWRQLVVSVDDNVVRLYQDGVQAQCYVGGDLVSSWTATPPVEIIFKAIGGFGEYNFQGIVDTVALWTNALSLNDSIALYSFGSPGYPSIYSTPYSTAYEIYKLNEGTGTNIYGNVNGGYGEFSGVPVWTTGIVAREKVVYVDGGDSLVLYGSNLVQTCPGNTGLVSVTWGSEIP